MTLLTFFTRDDSINPNLADKIKNDKTIKSTKLCCGYSVLLDHELTIELTNGIKIISNTEGCKSSLSITLKDGTKLVEEHGVHPSVNNLTKTESPKETLILFINKQFQNKIFDKFYKSDGLEKITLDKEKMANEIKKLGLSNPMLELLAYRRSKVCNLVIVSMGNGKIETPYDNPKPVGVSNKQGELQELIQFIDTCNPNYYKKFL